MPMSHSQALPRKQVLQATSFLPHFISWPITCPPNNGRSMARCFSRIRWCVLYRRPDERVAMHSRKWSLYETCHKQIWRTMPVSSKQIASIALFDSKHFVGSVIIVNTQVRCKIAKIRILYHNDYDCMYVHRL